MNWYQALAAYAGLLGGLGGLAAWMRAGIVADALTKYMRHGNEAARTINQNYEVISEGLASLDARLNLLKSAPDTIAAQVALVSAKHSGLHDEVGGIIERLTALEADMVVMRTRDAKLDRVLEELRKLGIERGKLDAVAAEVFADQARENAAHAVTEYDDDGPCDGSCGSDICMGVLPPAFDDRLEDVA